MVMRFLTAALFCEGPEDEAFLCAVFERQLRFLGLTGKGFAFESVAPQGCLTARAGSGQLDEAVIAASESFDLVFLHNDHERQKCVYRDTRLQGRLSPHARSVNVVPVRETESWALADEAALPGASGGSRDLPAKAHEVEKIADPKAVLRHQLGRKYSPELAEAIGLGIRLERLAEVPAYQNFLQDLTTALKELNFR